MEKNIKITRPAGEDTYKVLCAFKNGENSYVILDSKLKLLHLCVEKMVII